MCCTPCCCRGCLLPLDAAGPGSLAATLPSTHGSTPHPCRPAPLARPLGSARAPAPMGSAWPARFPLAVTARSARCRDRPGGLRPTPTAHPPTAHLGPAGGLARDRHRGRVAPPTPALWEPPRPHRLDHHGAAGPARLQQQPPAVPAS